jgi:hypothetical protein
VERILRLLVPCEGVAVQLVRQASRDETKVTDELPIVPGPTPGSHADHRGYKAVAKRRPPQPCLHPWRHHLPRRHGPGRSPSVGDIP